MSEPIAGLRCLIDSMIFDAIDDAGLTALVDRLTSARRLELLATPTSIAQVAAIPDPARRRRLRRVRVLVVPPADGDPSVHDLLAALRHNPGVGHDDALIAAAAAIHNVPLVTEDRDLGAAVAEHLPRVPVWRWAADLRPAIIALGTEATQPPRRAFS